MPATAPPTASSPATTGPPPRGRPPRRAWFASDFHLDRRDPDGVDRALRLLAAVRDDGADALFLLGDVFKAWLGPPSLEDPGLRPFLDGLRETVAAGVRVALVHGNHDFLMGPELEGACGVEVHAEHLDVALGGRHVRLLHGDAFCTRDVDYHRLHRVLRSRSARWLFRALPKATLESLADRLVHEATRTTGHKTREEMAIVDAEVAAVFDRGVDVVVCGHVHEARDARLPGEGGERRLVVMADFERSGCHARWVDGRLVLHRVDARFRRPVVVAIDGPAGSGKSSVSREVAERLGFLRLDSGALYRTVTSRVLARGLDPETADLGAVARALDLAVGPDGGVLLAGLPVDDALLRSPEVSAAVSRVSADPGVRAALLPVQRAAARVGAGLVAEGRDMATVVFPDAAVSVYLDARPEVRARRRLAQGSQEGGTVEEVVAALTARDARDSGRDVAPLAEAPGAVRLDTSDLTREEVVERLVGLAVAAGARAPEDSLARSPANP